MKGENQKWYVQLDGSEGETIISSQNLCGKSIETPSCNLQEVLNNAENGDTVYLRQVAAAGHSWCNQSKEINITVTKSVILQTQQPDLTKDGDSIEGIHGIQFNFNKNCSERCTVEIRNSQFACSLITFNDLNIRIENSKFRNSFLTAKSISRLPAAENDIMIGKTVFKNNYSVDGKNESIIMNTESCKQRNYICLTGQWNSIEILKSNLEGDRQSKVSGVEVMLANIHTLNLIDVQVSFMYYALVVAPFSTVGVFNVTQSIFLGNRDGIDIGEGIKHVVVSRSEMNYTGSWFEDGEVLEQCSSALRGNAQMVKVEDSVFAHNQASGMNCKGAALYLRTSVYKTLLLPSNNVTNGIHDQQIHTIEILKSVFYDNMLENCSIGFSGSEGGAIAVDGLQLWIKIVASTFVRNEARKGAGLYLGMSDRWPIRSLPNDLPGHIMSSKLIIDRCTFTENIAEFGGALMAELTECILCTGSSVSTLIHNTSFIRNNASHTGAGAYLKYVNVSIDSGVEVIITMSDTDFRKNINTGDNHPAGLGGGIAVQFTSVSISNTSVKTMVNNCTFISNRARWGAGILIVVHECSIDSSIVSQVTRSTFTSNTAGLGSGIYTVVRLCFVDSNSFILSQVTGSTFTNNTAEYWGAGIYTVVKSCSVVSNSSIILRVTGSTFTYNKADYHGAGIFTDVYSCSVYFNSFIMSWVTGSTFTFNAAGHNGAGIYTWVELCSLDNNSFVMSQVIGSTFTNNRAWPGAGIFTGLQSCSLYSNSSIMLQVTGSTFTNNTAVSEGGGFCTWVKSCSVDSNSSIMSQVIGSTFTNNTAEIGAGIYTWVEWCSLESKSSIMTQVTGSTFTSNMGGTHATWVRACSITSYSSIMLQTTSSNFTLNTGWFGAGISAKLLSCSIDSTSSFTTQTSDSVFSSNSAERGAGLYVDLYSKNTCVSGKVTIATDNCRFFNNSASMEGGSLYLMVFHIVHVYVKYSAFETNRALPGSGLYRENIDVQTCDTVIHDLDTQALIKTKIFQCHFINNIDTAILVKSRQRYGTLGITKSLFKNNRCINSSFAEDIYTDVDLESNDTDIVKKKNFSRIVGINSQSDAILRNVTVDNIVLSYKRQIIIAVFSHYITQTTGSSFEYQCPAFYRPMLSTAGLTKTGAIMVRATCDACFEGYYTGETWIVISAENNSDYHCIEKQLFNQHGEVAGKNKFCYTKALGKCNKCPHGGNCTAGAVALPNYWGHMTAADRLEFHRCPVGYCCNQAPCEGIDQCAAHREGTLCGRCIKGFSESLLSPECLPDDNCNDIWLLPLFVLWGFLVTQVLIFMGKFEKLGNRLLDIFRHFISKRKTVNSSQDQSNETDEGQKTKPFVAQVDSDGIPKVPILWGLLATQHPQRTEPSGSHKYLQIILYYLQDSALMQVDLAIGSTGSTIEKIRKVLLNVSQLAVDMLDLGLKLCPIQGWTPVVKLATKNLTGPLIFCFLFVIYGAITVSSKCCPNRKQSIRLFWYSKLTAATIFALLLFYQQIANTTFSLLYCIKSGNQSILFIDGTVTCYQLWQIIVLIFAFNWVIAIIPVLMFLPGLLELRLISVTDFFLACLLPGPMLCYWMYRFFTKKFCFHPSYVTPWQDEALGILQKTFVPTTYRNMFPFCWLGFMKIRRLALVLIFTFVSNLVGRVTLMCIVIQLFLIIHLATQPYQDKMANDAYTVSLLATLCIGLINIMKATCVEFYLDLDKVKHSLETLNLITDVIFVYCPPAFIVLAIITIVWRKFRTSMKTKKGNEENKQD